MYCNVSQPFSHSACFVHALIASRCILVVSLVEVDYKEAEFKYFVGKLHIWLAMYQKHCYLSVFSQYGNVTKDWAK